MSTEELIKLYGVLITETQKYQEVLFKFNKALEDFDKHNKEQVRKLRDGY
jgi:chloramphenicol O-acetyltransferase